MKLRPYQETSVQRLAQMRRGMLGHDPGLGKTIIAIRALDQLAARRVLVVTTVSSLFNWQREFINGQKTPRSTCVITESSGTTAPACSDVTIIAYSQLSNVTAAYASVLACKWDAIIFDEAHALKSMSSQRTKAAYFGLKTKWAGNFGALITDVPIVFALSGTFVPNGNYGEAYPHLAALRPDIMQDYPSLDSFMEKFCRMRQTTYGVQVLGGKNVPELRELLKPVLHRYSKKHVIRDLPAMQFVSVPLSLSSDSGDALKAFADMLRDAGVDPASPTLASDLQKSELAISSGRRMLGMIKAPAVIQFVIDELEENSEKRILFAHHKSVIDTLQDRLQVFAPVVVRGGQQAQQRQDAVDKFQTDPDCRLFIGQIDAAGEAITLTAASRVIFAEYSWSPAKNYQAACRADRIGQKSGVLAQVLTVANSLDETIGEVIARKAQATAELFGRGN